MIKLNNEAKTKLPEFLALTKLNDREGYLGPTEFKTSNHGDQYGWPGTCKGCRKVWCISVASNGTKLSVPQCFHDDGTYKEVFATNTCIENCQRENRRKNSK